MKGIFLKPINRDINGVIKVGQLAEGDIKQELDEYVLTRELNREFDRFFSHYVASLATPTDKIGVWISGFFGSGKSHLLKILSYLLENREVAGTTALACFEQKVGDPKMLADLQRAAGASKDVILFNIDSKAEASSKADKEAVVKVFMKVFDEHLGYFGAAPEIADFERRLEKQGKYGAFQRAYEKAMGESWKSDRENWDFREDEVVTALQEALGMTEEAARNFFDNFGERYSISVEKFAKIVRDYLSTRAKGHQVVFMVDEVGQYIGENSDLMLNLQTVAEDLGTHCGGRAWIVVTSQEDIDAVTQNRVKGNDFSKIQGRFKTRVSLSSANTDEVIKLRLLRKTEGATDSLRALYATKEQVLRNQVRFSSGTAEMPGYRSAEDFTQSYPFLPYQFKLLQQVFTQIRLHGASGKHLAAGERSMLDAFQIAALALPNGALGALAPFHLFYAAVEGFLDSAVKTIITQAADNARLQPFDVDLLKTLFMIKYVKEVKGTAENLTTLSITHIDEDRLALKERVEAALNRLEAETLIQRSSDVYEFLTNEEQDVSREIKNFTFNPGEVAGELQKLIWEEIFTPKKYRHDLRHDYAFNRKLDEQFHGAQTEDLTLHIVTPNGDEYRQLQEDANALMRSGSGTSVIVRLPDDKGVFLELTQYVKTDRYVKQKNTPGLSASIRTILQTRADENRERLRSIREALEGLIVEADVFVKGSKLTKTGSSAKDVLTSGLKALVEGTFTKLHYVRSPFESDDDIEGVLRGGTSGTQDLSGQHPNALAHEEMHHWLTEQRDRHQTVTLRTLEDHYAGKPYGWAKRDVHGVLAELLVQGKAELRHAQVAVDVRESDLVRKMTSRAGLDAYTVRVPRPVDPPTLKIARDLAQDYLDFATVPSDPQALFDRYRGALSTKAQRVSEQLVQARQGNYPFERKLAAHHKLLKELLHEGSPAAFFRVLREHEDDFVDLMEESSTIESFFRGQVDLFDKTRAQLAALESNLGYITDEALLGKVQEAKRILALEDPTKEIPKLGGLLTPVEEHVQALLEQHKRDALTTWQQACQQASTLAKNEGLPESELTSLLKPLTNLQERITTAPTIDAAIASMMLIEANKSQVNTAIIDKLNELIGGNGEVEKEKPIKRLRPAAFTKKSVLESEEDIHSYVDNLRDALLKTYQEGNRVRLE
jgi:hypothetical protein